MVKNDITYIDMVTGTVVQLQYRLSKNCQAELVGKFLNNPITYITLNQNVILLNQNSRLVAISRHIKKQRAIMLCRRLVIIQHLAVQQVYKGNKTTRKVEHACMIVVFLGEFSNLSYFGIGQGQEHSARSPGTDFDSLTSAFILSGAIVSSVSNQCCM